MALASRNAEARRKKIRRDRSLPRGHWRLPSRSRIFTRSVFAREFFLSPSPYIDVNLAPIKAAAHVRRSLCTVASRTNELASSVLLRFKEPIKIPRWPTLRLTNAMCARDSTMRLDNRSRTWSRSDTYVAAHRRKLLSLPCTGMSSKLHAKQAAWIREIPWLVHSAGNGAEKKKVYVLSYSQFRTSKTCFER